MIKRHVGLALALAISATCVPVRAIEIKEVNKTTANTLKILLGSLLALKGFGGMERTFGPAITEQGVRKLLGLGYHTGFAALGIKLVCEGYVGLKEDAKTAKPGEEKNHFNNA